MTTNRYRFLPSFPRRAVCVTCRGLVRKQDVVPHARWHAGQGHEGAWVGADPQMSAFCDVRISGIHALTTGWVTAGTGPR